MVKTSALLCIALGLIGTLNCLVLLDPNCIYDSDPSGIRNISKGYLVFDPNYSPLEGIGVKGFNIQAA